MGYSGALPLCRAAIDRVVRTLPFVTGAAAVALCVMALVARADAPPGHYTDLGDGTVRDNETGLVWQETADGANRTQAGSIAYCDALVLGGSSGWRLPSVLELRSIVDETRSSPAIDATFFLGTSPNPFWSASPRAGSPGDGWYVEFDYGDAYYVGGASPFPARCVR